jgi:hypothetical protein
MWIPVINKGAHPSESVQTASRRFEEEPTMKTLLACTAVICILAPFLAYGSEMQVGSIKTVKGTASIIRNRTPIDTKAGTRIFRNDSLKTGANGSLAMVFRDDTLLSMGPDSEVAINEFLFSPAEGKLAFVTRLLRGSAACMTGIIGKLSPESVRFETPVANIGIRGTAFAVKVEDPDK